MKKTSKQQNTKELKKTDQNTPINSPDQPKIHSSYDKLQEQLEKFAQNIFKTFQPSSIIESFPQIKQQSRFNKSILANLFKQSRSYASKNAISEINHIMEQYGIKKALDEIDAINMRKQIFEEIEEENWVDEEDQQEEYLKGIKDLLYKKLRLLKQTIQTNQQ